MSGLIFKQHWSLLKKTSFEHANDSPNRLIKVNVDYYWYLRFLNQVEIKQIMPISQANENWTVFTFVYSILFLFYDRLDDSLL
jgi:hypothetical protein